MRDIALLLSILLISVLMGVVYALPTIIADYRNDRHLIPIWVLNFFGERDGCRMGSCSHLESYR